MNAQLSNLRKTLVVVASIAALVGLPAAPASAAPPEQPRAPETDARALPRPERSSAAEWKNLADKARQRGTVKVLVALDVETRAEGDLSGDERAAQRRAIASARAQVLKALAGRRVPRVESLDEIPYVMIEAGADALDALQRSPLVTGVAENRELSISTSPPLATSSNTTLDPWWHYWRMNVDDSSSRGYTGRGQTVAVLDTGVESTHPHFGGRVVSEACFSSHTETSSTGYCPNGQWTQTGPGTGAACEYSGSCAHGTHVAGIAAGTYGVAAQSGIIAIQVFHPSESCKWWESVPCPRTSDWDLLAAMRHVYSLREQDRIAAVNLSVGHGRYSGFCDSATKFFSAFAAVVANLRSYGIATVAASGNDGYSDGIAFPACISNVVPVGNSTLDASGSDAVYDAGADGGSNSSAYVWLLAPGTQICSAMPSLFGMFYNACDMSTTAETMSGTSMAAPQVAGAFATLKQLRPTTSVTSALNALWYSGTFVTDSRNDVRRPRIDVWQSLVYLYNH